MIPECLSHVCAIEQMVLSRSRCDRCEDEAADLERGAAGEISSLGSKVQARPALKRTIVRRERCATDESL